MLLVGGTPTGICPSVSVDSLGGGVAVPGRPPAPLTEIDPEPLHGKPVTGLVPVALPPIAAVEPGNEPGLIGDTGGSPVSGRLNGVNAFCTRISAGRAAIAGSGFAAAKPCARPAAAPNIAPAATTAATSASFSKAFARIALSSSQSAPDSLKSNSLKSNSLKSILSAAPPQRSIGCASHQYLFPSAPATQIGHAAATEYV